MLSYVYKGIEQELSISCTYVHIWNITIISFVMGNIYKEYLHGLPTYPEEEMNKCLCIPDGTPTRNQRHGFIQVSLGKTVN